MIHVTPTWRVILGDTIAGMATLPAASVHCCVTSPPYWGLRDYGVDGQIGLESTPAEYLARMVDVFRAVKRVLRDDGTLWVNMGDAYASKPPGCKGVSGSSGLNGIGSAQYRETLESGHGQKRNTIVGGLKPKDLIGQPWALAFALRADGWYLRSDIIWHKPNPMPESVTDRPTKSHEYMFLLSKNERYYFDQEAVKEPQSEGTFARFGNGNAPRKTTTKAIRCESGEVRSNASFKDATPDAILAGGRNIRTVWTIPTQSYSGAHFATFPERLVEPCIKAGCPVGGTVLDPFTGSGTAGEVAVKLGRSFVGCELNPEYREMARERIGGACPLLAREAH